MRRRGGAAERWWRNGGEMAVWDGGVGPDLARPGSSPPLPLVFGVSGGVGVILLSLSLFPTLQGVRIRVCFWLALPPRAHSPPAMYCRSGKESACRRWWSLVEVLGTSGPGIVVNGTVNAF